VVACKTNNDGSKREGASVPSARSQEALYMKVYGPLNFDPSEVDYIESHATSTQIGDQIEVKSIESFFCANRNAPLKVGSVKSCMGHAEGASGMSSLVKSILMFENEKFMPNINLETLRDDCPALSEGRIEIVTEVEDFKGKYIGVNNFGIIGANAHTLLKKNMKEKVDGGLPKDDLPRLVLWSGRTEEAVNAIFDNIARRPLDDEFIALVQNCAVKSSDCNTVRGFGVFAKSYGGATTTCINRSMSAYKEDKRPVAFVFPGVGSQWFGMGRDLMKIPIVAEAIERCYDILAAKDLDLDLKRIITSNDPETFNDPLQTFVGVAAIQVGLTNLLKALKIVPDFIIGHSVGELGCAYADETLSLEEMILAAYSRGVAINQTKKESAMAAIGLGFQELSKVVPEGIEIVCHNSSTSCTVSGGIDDISSFVAQMKAEKVLAKVIDSSGVAFHSSKIADSGPKLLQMLQEIIKHPKPRSSKWISTSVPIGDWNKPECLLSSAEYHTNNLLSPVLFEEGVSMLTENVLMIEIAPHALLLPILKRSVPGGICMDLTKKDVDEGVAYLLNGLGR
jgi:fatty acid synthase, animal type